MVEQTKWFRTEDGQRIETTREERLCRFCVIEPKSLEHATLECGGSVELKMLQADFWVRTCMSVPTLPIKPTSFCSLADGLGHIFSIRDMIRLVAKFAHQVISVYKTAPMYMPERHEMELEVGQ